MTNPYPAAPNPPSAPPSSASRASPPLPAPILPPYPFSTTHSHTRVNAPHSLPSIPPFSSLPLTSSGATSGLNSLPTTLQVSQAVSNESSARFDQMRPSPVRLSQTNQPSSQSNGRDHVPSPPPLTAHSLPPHFNRFDSYHPGLQQQQPIVPLHPSRQTQSFALPHPIDLPLPNQPILPSFHATSDVVKNEQPLPRPPMHHSLPLDNPPIPCVPTSRRLNPLPMLKPFADRPPPSKAKLSPPLASAPHPRPLPQPPLSPSERHLAALPPRPHQSPPPLQLRPTMLAGPRGPAVMQAIPESQRTPLPPRSGHSNQRSMQPIGRLPSSPDFKAYCTESVALPPFDPARSISSVHQLEQRSECVPRSSPNQDVSVSRRDTSSSPLMHPAVLSPSLPQEEIQSQAQSAQGQLEKSSHITRAPSPRSQTVPQVVQAQPLRPQSAQESNLSQQPPTNTYPIQRLQSSSPSLSQKEGARSYVTAPIRGQHVGQVETSEQGPSKISLRSVHNSPQASKQRVEPPPQPIVLKSTPQPKTDRASPVPSVVTSRSGEGRPQKTTTGTEQSPRSSKLCTKQAATGRSDVMAYSTTPAKMRLQKESLPSSSKIVEGVPLNHSGDVAQLELQQLRTDCDASAQHGQPLPTMRRDILSDGKHIATQATTESPLEAKAHIQRLVKNADENEFVGENEMSGSRRKSLNQRQGDIDGFEAQPNRSQKDCTSMTAVPEGESRLEREKRDHDWQAHGMSKGVVPDQSPSLQDQTRELELRRNSPVAWENNHMRNSASAPSNTDRRHAEFPPDNHKNVWSFGSRLPQSYMPQSGQPPFSLSQPIGAGKSSTQAMDVHVDPPQRPPGVTSSSHSQTDDATSAPPAPLCNSIIKEDKPSGQPLPSVPTQANYHNNSSDHVPKVPTPLKPPKDISEHTSSPVIAHLSSSTLHPSIIVTKQAPQVGEQGSRIESYPAAQSSPLELTESTGHSQRKQLKVEDALAYLEKVKIQFADQLNVYNQFLDIMKEFKAQSIDTAEVIKRVSELFRGHKDLILGFNTFLPPGYKIQVTENRATGALNAGFVGPQGKFSELPSYGKVVTKSPSPRPLTNKKQSASLEPISKEVNHPPPDSLPIKELPTPVSKTEPKLSPKNPIHPGLNGTPSKPLSPMKPIIPHRVQPKAKVMEDSDRLTSLPPVILSEGHQTKSVEFERAMGFMKRIKERFADDPEMFSEFLGAMQHFRDEQKSIREVFDTVAQLFGPHKDLLSQFKEFIPMITHPHRQPSQHHSRRPTEERSVSNQIVKIPSTPSMIRKRIRTRDMKFFDKMKTQLGPNKSHLYTEFIKCLSLLSQGIVSHEELLLLTSEILRDCADAQNAFLNYLDSLGTNDDSASSEGRSSSSSSGQDATPVDEERMRYYRTKPMSEIAAECGYDAIVSYRKMPKDFPKYVYGGRTTQERRILNDTWVNVTTGSEDFAFVRKNGNEDNLFRAEDDRYELDMVISTNRATIQKLEGVVSTMCKLAPAEKNRHALAPGVLSAIHFNSIRRIYGPHGDEVVSQVKMNPSVAVPIVIPRMKQKDAEWRKVRGEMNKVWREVGERNFHRSLDHRSGFFKVIDKKDLNVKNLLMDIMDPANSMVVRDAEMTRARNYAIPKGAGGAFDRSGATKAVIASAQIPHNLAPRSLELKFEKIWIHKIAHSMMLATAVDEASADVKAGIVEFGYVLEGFFDVDLNHGTRREQNNFNDRKNAEGDYNVLFGDESIYVLFRLYHILYERLLTALELAHEQVRDRERRIKLNRSASTHAATESIVKSRIMKHGTEKDGDCGFSLGPESGTGMDVFHQFLEMAKPFIRGKLESSKYEEKCRVLLGTGSYCVFTLDKVMQRLIKQIGSVFIGDRIAHELIKLFNLGQRAAWVGANVEQNVPFHCKEQVYSICASRHLAENRPAGSHLMRLVREYCHLRGKLVEIGDEKLRRGFANEKDVSHQTVPDFGRDTVGCALTIEVIAEVGDEEYIKRRKRKQDNTDTFLGFCAAFEDCIGHDRQTKSEGIDENVSGEGDYKTDGTQNVVGHRDHKLGGRNFGSKIGKGGLGITGVGGKQRDKRNGRDENVQPFKKLSGLEAKLARFHPKMTAEAARRAVNMISGNGLRCTMIEGGVLRYSAGTMDWMFVPGRKRKRSPDINLSPQNVVSGRTKKFRKTSHAKSFVGKVIDSSSKVPGRIKTTKTTTDIENLKDQDGNDLCQD